jgi:ABC-2 type transport system ATP-binding protein
MKPRNGEASWSARSDAAAVETRDLRRSYGATNALDGLGLTVPRGGVYGILGPNGAGKTTLIRVLATLARPSAGQARVLGFDVRSEADAVRRRIGLTGQFASVDPDLTGDENLVLVGRLVGLSARDAQARSRELLDEFGLTEAAGRLARTFSGGMRRRLDIAGCMVAAPMLLFLDEPTTGLDPRSRREVWGMVRELVANGTTVLLTTQNLDEADHLADRIAVIDHGRLIAEGTPSQLKSMVGAGSLQIRLADEAHVPEAERLLATKLGVTITRGADSTVLDARVADAIHAISALVELRHQAVPLLGYALAQPSLDEVFLSLTGHPADPSTQKEVAT